MLGRENNNQSSTLHLPDVFSSDCKAKLFHEQTRAQDSHAAATFAAAWEMFTLPRQLNTRYDTQNQDFIPTHHQSRYDHSCTAAKHNVTIAEHMLLIVLITQAHL